jgi:hypothetical protein
MAATTYSSSTWTFATASDRSWWAGLWAERCTTSSFAQRAVEYGITTAGELEALAQQWRAWAEDPAAVFVVVHGEVLSRLCLPFWGDTGAAVTGVPAETSWPILSSVFRRRGCDRPEVTVRFPSANTGAADGLVDLLGSASRGKGRHVVTNCIINLGGPAQEPGHVGRAGGGAP